MERRVSRSKGIKEAIMPALTTSLRRLTLRRLTLRKLTTFAASFMLLAAIGGAPSAVAQGGPPPGQQPTAQLMSAEQLDQLVAPIALYRDNLLGQILTASTYPLETVMAARWSAGNPNVKGGQLE